MAQTDQLQREAEETRRQLAATLDELRGRLAPAAIRRDVLDAARRSTVGRFAANFGVDATNNAVPLAGIAASIAWVMLSKGRRRGAAPPLGSYARVRDTAGHVVGAAGQVAAGAGRATAAAQDAARSLSQTASDAAQRVSKTSSAAMASTRAAGDSVRQHLTGATEATRRAGRGARDLASSAGRQAALTAGTAYKVARHDPVFAAGLGLAVVGVAAAAFGWSRKPGNGQAVSDLAKAAKKEHPAMEPELTRVGALAVPISPRLEPDATNYGRDLTAAESSAARSR